MSLSFQLLFRFEDLVIHALIRLERWFAAQFVWYLLGWCCTFLDVSYTGKGWVSRRRDIIRWHSTAVFLIFDVTQGLPITLDCMFLLFQLGLSGFSQSRTYGTHALILLLLAHFPEISLTSLNILVLYHRYPLRILHHTLSIGQRLHIDPWANGLVRLSCC